MILEMGLKYRFKLENVVYNFLFKMTLFLKSAIRYELFINSSFDRSYRLHG